jgi:uncharacterized membrane protein required for colicin V production
MIGLDVLLLIFIILFGVVGSMRGWAKELLVTFAIILALFISNLLERFVPFIRDNLAANSDQTLFWIRTTILLLMVIFGYQTPNIPKLAGSNRFVRERLQDVLLGLFLGAFNGFLIFGTIWSYLNDANYPFSIIQPPPASAAGDFARQLIFYLPPHWLGTPTIYFAVAVAFAFVIVVFI